MARQQKHAFVPGPVSRPKSVKTLAKEYDEVSAEIEKLRHKQARITAQIRAQIDIGYETAVKTGIDEYRKVGVSKCLRVGYDSKLLRQHVKDSILTKCESRTPYVKVTVNPCSEDVYLTFF